MERQTGKQSTQLAERSGMIEFHLELLKKVVLVLVNMLKSFFIAMTMFRVTFGCVAINFAFKSVTRQPKDLFVPSLIRTDGSWFFFSSDFILFMSLCCAYTEQAHNTFNATQKVTAHFIFIFRDRNVT